MGKLSKRDEGTKPAKKKGKGRAQPRPRTAGSIVLQRLRQGCYGICAGAFVAIPSALVGEHTPTWRSIGIMIGVMLFAGATGLALEIIENRVFPGGGDDEKSNAADR